MVNLLDRIVLRRQPYARYLQKLSHGTNQFKGALCSFGGEIQTEF